MLTHYLRNSLPWQAPFSNPVLRIQLRPNVGGAWDDPPATPGLAAVPDAPMSTIRKGIEREAWRAQAIEAYEHFLPIRRAGLTATLANRLLALTGITIPGEDIFVDAAGQLAVVRIDGVTFRMDQYGHLIVLRGCAWCGTGEFESPRVTGPESLGFAIGHWTPLHEGCNDIDPSED